MSPQARLWLRVAADIQQQLLAFRRSRHKYVEQQLALVADDLARLESLRRKLNICEARG